MSDPFSIASNAAVADALHAFEASQDLCARQRELRRGDQVTPITGPQAGTVYEVGAVVEGRVIVRGSCGADSTPASDFDRLPLTIESIATELERAWEERPQHAHGDVIVGWLGNAIANAVADLRIVRNDADRPEAERGQVAVYARLLKASGALIASMGSELEHQRNARWEAEHRAREANAALALLTNLGTDDEAAQ